VYSTSKYENKNLTHIKHIKHKEEEKVVGKEEAAMNYASDSINLYIQFWQSNNIYT
jgi:hypothetical protein